jgi:hypothetical protein
MSLLFGLAAFIMMFFITRELFEWDYLFVWAGFVPLYIFSTATMHTFTEIRMYSLAIMLATISFYFAVRFVKSDGKKYSGWFFVASALMMFTHYYTGLFFVVECVYILLSLRKKLINMPFIINGALFGMYMAFLFAYFMAQRTRVFGLWFQGVSWYSMVSTFHYYFFYVWGDMFSDIATVYGMLFVALYFAIILWAIYFSKSSEKKNMMFLFLFGIVPPFIGMIINNYIMRVYHHRLFMFGAWCMILLLAVSIYELYKKNKYVYYIVGIAIFLYMILNIFSYFGNMDMELKEANQILIDRACDTNATVIHESMFSAGPSIYYSNLNGCKNIHYIFSDIPPEAMHSAGFDAVGDWRVFRNEDASQFLPTYYFSHNDNLARGATCETLYNRSGLMLEYCI